MCKKEIKIKVIEQFKNEDIEKRKETFNKLFYKIIKAKEISVAEVNYESCEDIK